MVYLEHSSSRFWRCEVSSSRVTTTFGKCGTKGQQRTKDFDSEEDAKTYFTKQEASKRKGGYQDAADPDAGAAAASPAANKKRKTATAAAAVTPSPSAKKKGLAGHAAPNLEDDDNGAANKVDSGVAGVDAALASRVIVHETLHAKLALVDPALNSDKYYILQVLVDDGKTRKAKTTKGNSKSGPDYYLFTRWGRTGTGGQAKLEGPFSNKGEKEAEEAFAKIFRSKTGVKWDNAVAGSPPLAGKYEYLAASIAGSAKGSWYYYLQNDPLGKPDGWYPYDEDNCKEVEDLYESYVAANKPQRLSKRVVTSESSGFQYQVDLQAMQQTNLQSGTKRPIGRTDNGQAPTTIPTTTTAATAAIKAAVPAPKAAPKIVLKSPPAKVAASAPTRVVRKVDPAAGAQFQLNGKIYEDYDVMLNQTNLGANNNKFYKIQLIVVPGQFFVFTKWGRVGEDGKTQLQGPYARSDDAIKEFSKKFRSKTANKWEDYQQDKDSFISKKGKYTPLEMEQDEDAAEAMMATTAKAVSPCQLDKSTQALIDLIFDQDIIRGAMTKMNLDPKKLPLGALSQAQIAKGFAVLEKLEDEINANNNDQRLTDLTSEFYTVIPHAFGRSRGPVLNSIELVQEKYEMLNTLTDIEAAQAMQKNTQQQQQNQTNDDDTQPHPSDLNYQQLASDLNLLDPSKDKDYKLIETYFQNTKNDMAYGGGMELRQVWRVNRHTESARFAQHSNLPTRKLLWHGTNVAVVAAILKSGLRIMPHSGGRVGRGIYLADQHQKSAWYTSGAKGTKIMFLVEAALGESHEILRDDPSLIAAPPGFDSVLAKGRTGPAASGDVEIDIDGKSVVIPQGEPEEVHAATHSAFEHNEFLIYKESQHRIRYILTFDEN